MRTFLLFVLILALLTAGAFAYLTLTTPASGNGVHFPLNASERTLLSYVPREAELFAILPTATVTYKKLLGNPVARQPIEDWTAHHQMPSSWMLGGADLVLWKAGDRTSYAVRVDPVRAAIIRVYLMMAGDPGDGAASFRINAIASDPLDAPSIGEIEALATALPAGDLLLVQRSSRHGGFPPMARPAVSTASVTPAEIFFTSHAVASDVEVSPQPVTSRFPRGALMTAWFAKPPRPIDDLSRLLGTRVSPLVSEGGQVVLYDVQTRTLLPRPKGVFVLPADEPRRQAIQNLEGLASKEVRDVLGVKVETLEKDGQFLVAFDDSSIPAYSKEVLEAAAWPANRWSVRLDPLRFVPILEKLDGNPGLRLAAPRLFRSARDLRHWVGYLGQARLIEAADSVSGNTEELRVRISSK